MQKSWGKGISYVYKQFDGTRAGLTSPVSRENTGESGSRLSAAGKVWRRASSGMEWNGELTNRTCFWEVPGEAAGGGGGADAQKGGL